jgi:hypothetical protein
VHGSIADYDNRHWLPANFVGQRPFIIGDESILENEQKIVKMSCTVNLLLAHMNKVALVDLLSDSLKQLSSDLNIENIAEKRYSSLL